MANSVAVDILNRALHGTVNSVVQYIETATPHVPEGLEEDFRTVQRMRNEEVELATRLTELIGELEGVPKVGVFPYWNVDLNYLDLRFLCRFAAKHEAKVLAEIQLELDAVKDHPKVHRLLKEVLEQKARHLEQLHEIGARKLREYSEEEIAAAQPKDAQHVPRAWSES